MSDGPSRDKENENESDKIDRRKWLQRAGALGAFALVGSEKKAEGSLQNIASGVLRRMCYLTPANIEGPYFRDYDLLRKDITEGKPGWPMTLYLQVVYAADCTPIADAAVDIWHCDAGGLYSDVPQLGTQGETFLRGLQITDATGVVCFDTIFPGWYTGRTTHFHIKVHLADQTLLTTQLYFHDSFPDVLYTNHVPYKFRGPRDTTNQQDAFYLKDLELTTYPPYCGMILGVV